MKVVVVIPARGGSKRIPRKNLALVAGKPLLAWSIEHAQSSRFGPLVVVSSDDQAILDQADVRGVNVIRRPDGAATDDAPIEAALWHVHQEINYDYDYMVTLQPTCPVREPGLMDRCIERAEYLQADCVFTARAFLRCWLWQESTGADWLEGMVWERLGHTMQSQQATLSDKILLHDGSVCVTTRDVIERRRDRLGGRAIPLLVEPTVDIDTPEDLALAEALMSARMKVAA